MGSNPTPSASHLRDGCGSLGRTRQLVPSWWPLATPVAPREHPRCLERPDAPVPGRRGRCPTSDCALPLPLNAADRAGGYWWEISMRRVEVYRTLVFDAPRHGRSFFEFRPGLCPCEPSLLSGSHRFQRVMSCSANSIRRTCGVYGPATAKSPGVMVAADKPPPVPRNCSHAEPRSLVDRPGKYSSGSASARKRDYVGGSVASRACRCSSW